MNIPSVTLKPGREKSLRRRHPWIFSGAIANVSGQIEPGETVCVLSAGGDFLALGSYSPFSQIRVRMWSFDAETEINASFFHERLRAAFEIRRSLLDDDTACCRLVNAESDGLPGLVVDRYADFVVCQFTAVGVEHWKKDIINSIKELIPCKGIYERSDGFDREKEGMQPSTGVLYGVEPPDYIEIAENGCKFLVDVRNGHKTGFYIDQRENRAYLAGHAAGADVLNCFAYTGGFGIYALKAGAANVLNIDASAGVLDIINRNAEINSLPVSKMENRQGDAFVILRQMHKEGRLFDIVVLDPPKFASSRDQLPSACRGYKDVNLQGFKLVKTGGLLVTFSCSSLMDQDLFSKIIADAALDAGREAQIIRRLGQSWDHPTLLSFPEGGYLKGLACRII